SRGVGAVLRVAVADVDRRRGLAGEGSGLRAGGVRVAADPDESRPGGDGVTQAGAVGSLEVGRVPDPRAASVRRPRTLSAGVTAVLALVVLTYVWRVQDLYPILGALQVPILGSMAAIAWFASSGATSRLRMLWSDPTLRMTTLMLGIMLAGVPFSVYSGLSLSFILDDHIRTFAA